eukprot:907030-Rhodomonas_salina.3
MCTPAATPPDSTIRYLSTGHPVAAAQAGCENQHTLPQAPAGQLTRSVASTGPVGTYPLLSSGSSVEYVSTGHAVGSA